MNSRLALFTKFVLIKELLTLIKASMQSCIIQTVVLSDKDYEANFSHFKEIICAEQIEILKYSDFLKNVSKSNNDYDCGISFMFATKIDLAINSIFTKGIVNFHPSLLPLNRGSDPISWAIYDKSKHGVTAHLVDAEFDQGAILSQEEIVFDFSFTAESLYKLSITKLKNLMVAVIPKWLNDDISPRVQIGDSTSHKKSELIKIKSIDYSDLSDTENLIRRLRASSFSPNDGLELKLENNTYMLYLKIEVKNEN